MHSAILLVVLLGTAPMIAMAAAYKCTDSAGKVAFSDTPCATSSAKGEKIFERGAGFNPLNAEEKSEFKKGVMMGCRAPRNVCECMSETLAETLTYEEVMHTLRNRSKPSAAMVEKSGRAAKSCQDKAQGR